MKENALKLFEFIIQQSKRKDLLIEESFNALADKMVELGFLYKDSKIEYIYWCSISPADIDKYKRITLDESIYDGYRVIHPLRIDDNKYFEYMLKIILKIIKRYGFFSKNIGKVISSMIIVIEQMIPFYNSYLVNKNIKNNKQTNKLGIYASYL